ncbi:hypothetical protein M3N64_03855 [Sporolactobacillus sp. CPB3-1]|uniref:DUF3784 domain-containing protein n=1 Tax=Sporolactobacillus mangiferae TaxID=2940498 RepID=A0ABT0M896_9BACL|nr:hypothetical protein [Sporolactobacillus mangiferae]MCL1631081.1 hypothetical protein [Sporolactobacillus mangiferae]
MHLLIGLGIILFICGIVLFLLRKKMDLPKWIDRRAKKAQPWWLAVSMMCLIAGIYSMVAPILTVMMGADYWILLYIGLIGCAMLLILILLPH